MRTMGSASPMLSSSSEALWWWVEGQGEVCMGRVLRFLDARWCNGGRLCAWGPGLYIGVSVVGGTDHGAITRTPRKTERACVGNRHEQAMDSWVNTASLHGELKGRDQSKDGVSSWGLLSKQRLFNLHGNRVTSVAGELKGLRAKQGQIITQRNKFLQTLRNQVIAQWFVRCSGTCRLWFDSGMQHIYFIFLTFRPLNKL